MAGKTVEAQVASLHGQIQRKLNRSSSIGTVMVAKFAPQFIKDAYFSFEQRLFQREVIEIADSFPLLDIERAFLARSFSTQIVASSSLETLRRANVLSPESETGRRNEYWEITQRSKSKISNAYLALAEELSKPFSLPVQTLHTWLMAIETAGIHLEAVFSNPSSTSPAINSIQGVLRKVVDARPPFTEDQRALLGLYGQMERRKITGATGRTRRDTLV